MFSGVKTSEVSPYAKTVLAYGDTSEVFTPENITSTFGGMSPNLLFGPES